MNTQRWEEIRAGFDAIVDLDPGARAGRLAALADSDPELHRALELLLKADAEATGNPGAPVGGFLPDYEHQPDPLEIAGRTISHFDVSEVLGAGGMGVVYRAHDRQLGRAVALKFLLPHYNLDASAKARFQREAHAAAALDHPNLCTVHEVGTTERGWLFLAMSLYEGETLRARLKRDGCLPISECLEIVRQIAEGLQAAHAAGVVHRDLKPGNVMLLPDGTVRILDFGLAKARDQSISETGAHFGTVSYMSPEQVRGDKVDGRADLWALGVLMYEMLTGRKPFNGDEEVAVALAILHDEPPLPSTYRSEISAALESLVLRLLRKDPGRRYASAELLLRDLARVRTLATGTVGMLLARARRVRRAVGDSLRRERRGVLFAASGIAAFVVAYLVVHFAQDSTTQTPTTSSEASTSAVSIAVVPFANVGGDSTNLPFSDGFADELMTALGKVKGMSVMSRTSAFGLKRKGLDAREIGNQLHVQYVVDGSVTRIGDRRRVGARLIEVATGKEMWSAVFDHNASTDDVFTVEDSVTRSIVHQVLPRISPVTIASAKRPTENREAHELYLQGRYFFERRDSAGLRKAQEYFRQAIATDSSYALAYAGLADAYGLQANFGFVRPGRNFPMAKRYAALALAHDSTLVEVHVSLAFIAMFHDWNWRTAQREFETALRLNERYAPIHLYRAWYFMATDSTDAAVSELRRAVDLDPFSGLNNTRLVTILFYTGHYPEALTQARKVFERDPNFVGVRQELARVYINLGRCPEALAALQNSADQPLSLLRGVRGYTYAKCGRRAEAEAELNRLLGRARVGEYVSHYALAIIQAGLGNDDQAIAELEKAYIERAPAMFVMKLEPAFARLHSDPRFVAVARKVGLTI
jgi:serine/threonine protein kinase/tetratricopeptide (TPR) repeat protein